MLLFAIFFIMPCSPYLLLSLLTWINNPVPDTPITPRQNKVLMPIIYRIAKRIRRTTSPPPSHQIYCAFNPLNSTGLLIPLLTLYTLFDITGFWFLFIVDVAE